MTHRMVTKSPDPPSSIIGPHATTSTRRHAQAPVAKRQTTPQLRYTVARRSPANPLWNSASETANAPSTIDPGRDPP
jgi:hypothetical protein